MKLKYTFFLLLTLLNYPLYALETVHVVGLFPGKVVVLIDGQTHVLKKGAKKQGVRYIRMQGNDIILEIDNVQSVYKMGAPVSLSFKERAVKTKTIYADKRGMFRTVGSINGQPINFLVDTGATTVAMSSYQAKKLNIQYRLEGRQTTASTASGLAKAYLIKLKTVKLGEITQLNVDGLVIEGKFPRQALLGMSFLNRLKVEKSGDSMVLESR